MTLIACVSCKGLEENTRMSQNAILRRRHQERQPSHSTRNWWFQDKRQGRQASINNMPIFSHTGLLRIVLFTTLSWVDRVWGQGWTARQCREKKWSSATMVIWCWSYSFWKRTLFTNYFIFSDFVVAENDLIMNEFIYYLLFAWIYIYISSCFVEWGHWF